MLNLKSVCFLVVLFLPVLSFAQATNDYRSAASGPWTTLATWERFEGTWLTPTVLQGTPTSGVGVITIQSGHTVNVPTGSTITIDQTTVAGTLQVDAGGGIIINAGAGTDLTISTGTLNVSGTFSLNNNATTSGTLITNTNFLSGSRYRHLWTSNVGVVPSATWNVNSTMEMAGFTLNDNLVAAGNWSQNFGNVEVNLANQTTGTTSADGFLTTIAGNLIITSTGTAGIFRLTNTQPAIVTIGGSFFVNGTSQARLSNSGSLTLTVSGSLSIANTAILITARGGLSNITVGSFSMTSTGSVNMAEQNLGVTTLNVRGNYSLASGTITKNGSAGAVVNINFIGTIPTPTVQTYSISGGSFDIASGRAYRFTVASGATVDCGTSTFSGAGTFALTGELRVGSIDANGAIQTGALGGNLRTTGVRTYNSGSTIRYNGAAAQVIGNGYPTVTSPGVNLIIDNASGVSLAAATPSVRVTGNLTLNNGILNIGGKALTLDGNIIQNSVGSTITVNATSDITVNGSGALGTFPFAAGPQTFRNFTLNRLTSGSVVFANDLTLVGAVTLTNGLMNFSGQALALNGTFSAAAGGALFSNDPTSTLSIGGAGALGTLVFDPAGNELQSLTMNRITAGTATLNSTLNVNVILDLLNGNFVNTSGLTLANGVNLTRASTSQLLTTTPVALGTYNVFYVGVAMTTGLELPAPASTNVLLDLTINGGTILLNQNLTINGYFTANSSNLNGGTFTITMNGDFWELNGGDFTPATSLVIFNGNTSVFGTVDPSFNNVQLTSPSLLSFPATNVSISGNIDLLAGSTFDANFSNVVLNNGVLAQAINANGAEFYAIQVNKAAGAVNITSPLLLQGFMNVTTATTINSTGNLTILSRGNFTDQDGSIGPLPVGASVVGSVSVQRFMQNIGNRNRYISSPVVGMPVSQLDFTKTNGSIRYYNEPTLGAIELGYTTLPLAGTFDTGRGYLAYMYDAINLTSTVDGIVHQSSINLPVSYTTSSGGALADGWNLVGNPYPSSIVWESGPGWSLTNIDPVISVTDFSLGGYPTYFRTSHLTDSPSGDLPNDVIAMGQSFWVHANAVGPLLTINEAAKNSTLLTGNFYRKSSNPSEQLIISINNGKMQDRSFLKLNQQATEDFDRNFDGHKLKNEEMNIYLMDNAQRSLVMHTLSFIPQDLKIHVGVEVALAGEYEITFSDLDRFSIADELYLVDSFEGIAVSVSSKEGYKFSIKDSSKPVMNRFYLSKNPNVTEKKIEDLVQTYPNPVKDELVITIPSNQRANVTLFDSQGLTLSVDEIQGSGRLDFKSYPPGMFLLKVSIGNEVMVKKIMK